MKTAGIITHCRIHNYGAMLQAFALKHAIKNAKAELIGYCRADYDRISQSGTHLLYEPMLSTPERYRRARAEHLDDIQQRSALFTAFSKDILQISRHYSSFEELADDCPQYDIYISGGDQIWNTMWYSNGVQFPYFLAFTNSKNKIAYGCGAYSRAKKPYHLDFENLPLLRQYKKIMVREEIGAKTLERYLPEPVEVVLDPALLLHAHEYLPIMRKPLVDIHEPYIFAYFLAGADGDTRNKQITHFLSEFAKRHNRKILLLSSNIPINNEYITTVTAAGPAEWLWLLHNSEGVITSSFHGTAFSVIFNRPFFTVFGDSRKRSLLGTLRLSSQLGVFEDLLERPEPLAVDFSEANELLAKERIRCNDLLRNAIEMCE